MELVRENIIYIVIALAVVIVLFFGLFSLFNRDSNVSVAAANGEVLGAFEMRQETPSGNFLVSYSYPTGWHVDQNGVTSNIGYFENTNKQMRIYYVFESFQEKYKGTSKKTFVDANGLKRKMYWKEYSKEDVYYIDTIWPVESLKSSVRFTCMGPKSGRNIIKSQCEAFIYSFRLD
ncbi:hypothetical protein KC678_03320 [Candidatus Dojkabacteria bacterium]|uniref:Uncharacterized protein n=1 Tax=Candidatus Dojkabacteria bacterium TaxID=2099670 RepID=A0A955RGR9_9BACT|nr:hypothetical protein [Candidatus Dojkabacteria bacterium]